MSPSSIQVGQTLCPGCWYAFDVEDMDNALGLCPCCYEQSRPGANWPVPNYAHATVLTHTRSLRINWSEVGWFTATLLLLCAIIWLGIWEAGRP